MKIAVFGSREGVSQETVNAYLEPRFRPDVVLVSGGARGVDTFAEQAWIRLGGRVLSFRPVKLTDEEFGAQCWKLGPWPEGQAIIPLEHPHPTFRRYDDALDYRSMLVAEVADRGVAFLANRSRGTGRTIWFFEVTGKTCVIKEEEHGTVT